MRCINYIIDNLFKFMRAHIIILQFIVYMMNIVDFKYDFCLKFYMSA